MKVKSRKLSQLEVAITDSLVCLEEEFGRLPKDVFLNLENLIYAEFEKVLDAAGSLPNVTDGISSNALFVKNGKVFR